MRSGFTLVELMLAVLLLALMMTVAYGVLVSTVQGQERIEEILASSEIGPAILAQICEDLEGAILPPKEGEKEIEGFLALSRSAPAGERDRIDFVTSRLAYGSRREDEEPAFHSVNEVGYQLRDHPSESGVAVLYRREDYFVDAEPLRGGRLIELYDRVTHFDLQFWNGERWQAEWSAVKEKGKLPKAVKVELRVRLRDREGRDQDRAFVTIVTLPR